MIICREYSIGKFRVEVDGEVISEARSSEDAWRLAALELGERLGLDVRQYPLSDSEARKLKNPPLRLRG